MTLWLRRPSHLPLFDLATFVDICCKSYVVIAIRAVHIVVIVVVVIADSKGQQQLKKMKQQQKPT